MNSESFFHSIFICVSKKYFQRGSEQKQVKKRGAEKGAQKGLN